MLTRKSSAAGSIRRPARIFGTAIALFLATNLFSAATALEIRAMNPGEDKNERKINERKIGNEKTAPVKADGKVEGEDYGEMSKLIEALEAQGFTVERTSKGHVMVYRDAILVVTFSGTASDWRAMKNGIAKARRFGFKWPPRR